MSEPEHVIEKFYSNIDTWINGHNILYSVDYDTEQVKKVLELGGEEIAGLTVHEINGHIFSLNKYLLHLAMVTGREKAAKHWADQGIWFLIAGKQYHDKFAKWEDKYYTAIRENKTCMALATLKNTCEFRLLTIEPQIAAVESMIRNLENIAKGKMYEHRT